MKLKIYLPKRNKNICLHKALYRNVRRNFFKYLSSGNGPNGHQRVNGWVNGSHPYNGLMPSNQKEQTMIHTSVHESREHESHYPNKVDWKKLITTGCIWWEKPEVLPPMCWRLTEKRCMGTFWGDSNILDRVRFSFVTTHGMVSLRLCIFTVYKFNLKKTHKYWTHNCMYAKVFRDVVYWRLQLSLKWIKED